MPSVNSTYFKTSHTNDIRSKDRWSHGESTQKYRSPFAKDRDRILYSKCFLRLRDKTQVFMMSDNDYIRTRLTHTLEVSQIARTLANAFVLDLDLTEAIALGHDVGHTPFGHIGERTLDKFTKSEERYVLKDKKGDSIEVPKDLQGFKHNLQSARVLCELEPGPEGHGLNLTKYTLWGIIHHTDIEKKENERIVNYPFYNNIIDSLKDYWSFEGYVVALADEIAQRHHDVEDSLRYNLIERDELVEFFDKLSLKKQDNFNYTKLKSSIKGDLSEFIALFSRFLVNMYVMDAIVQTKSNFIQLSKKFGICNSTDYINQRHVITNTDHSLVVSFSSSMKDFNDKFKQFTSKRVINSYSAQTFDGKGEYIIRKLFKAYFTNPNQMQDSAVKNMFNMLGIKEDRSSIAKAISGKENLLIRVIADYISGMTDSFAYDQFDLLYGTRR